MNFTYCPQCGKQGTVAQLDPTNHECSECTWHFWNNAKGAVAVVLVKDDKMLVSKRGRAADPHYGLYDFPGGSIDYNETAQAAAIREVKEETGVIITEENLELVAVLSHQYAPDNIPAIFTTDIVFVVRDWQGEPQPGDDSAALEWKPFDFAKDPSFYEKSYAKLADLLRTIPSP